VIFHSPAPLCATRRTAEIESVRLIFMRAREHVIDKSSLRPVCECEDAVALTRIACPLESHFSHLPGALQNTSYCLSAISTPGDAFANRCRSTLIIGRKWMKLEGLGYFNVSFVVCLAAYFGTINFCET